MLGLLKAKVSLKKKFSDVKELLFRYIESLDSQEQLKDLDDFLIRSRFIDRSELPGIEDRDRVLCRLTLDYSRLRYQDIFRFGEYLKGELMLMDDPLPSGFVKILELVEKYGVEAFESHNKDELSKASNPQHRWGWVLRHHHR